MGGDALIYWIGAFKNVDLVKKYFPGYICRFYIDKNCKQELIETIKGYNVEVILMNNEKYQYNNLSTRFNHGDISKFFNEYWTRPDESEKPKNPNVVEGAIYW